MTNKIDPEFSSQQGELASLKKELAFRDKQLTLIKDVVQEILTELDFEKLIHSIAQKAQLLVGADSLIVPILNKQHSHYTYKAACGKNAALMLKQSFPVSVGMCGWVLSNQRPLFFSQENEWLMDQKTHWEDGMESALLVPLKSRGKIVGGLSALGKGGGSFTQNDYDLLSLFASHISVAVDNARIFEELNEEKDYIETTLNSIGDAVITTDTEGRVQKVNPAARKLLAREEDEIQGQLLSEVFNIVNLSSRKAVKNPVETVLRTGKITALANNTVLLANDGAEYQIADSAAPIRDAQGKVQGVILVFRDVTEEHKLQVALKENQQQLQSILDNTPAVIYVKDSDGRYILINRQFETLFNISNEKIQGLTDYDLFPHDLADKFRKNDHHVLDTLTPLEVEEVAPHEDGLHTYISVKFPLFDNENTVNAICGISTDITEHLQSEEALRRSQKMDAIGQISGGIAHDFNNQLGVVIGYLDFLKNHHGENQKPRQWVDIATRATLRCMDLTRQLLAFSRRQKTEKIVVLLNASLQEFQTMIARSVTPEVEVQTSLADDLWLTELDPGDFQDAILNLVINARDAMPAGGTLLIETSNQHLDESYVALNPEISAGDYVQLMLSDTGVGMDQETLERVFEPFFTTKPEGKGTGLGMSMVYGFVKRYEGHIKIYSEPDVGTTTRIYLPRSAASEPAVKDETAREGRLPTGSESILIVDDESDLLVLAEQYLDDLGYRTRTAENGAQALQILADDKSIELLFSDVVMPGGMNGYELALQATELVRAQKRADLKVLLTSGFTSKALSNNGLSSFPIHLLAKPYRKTNLAQRIRQVLDEGLPQGQSLAKTNGTQGMLQGCTILVVDDEADIRELFSLNLKGLGCQAITASNGDDAIDLYQQTLQGDKGIDIVILDLSLPGSIGGTEIAKKIHALNPQAKIIVSSGDTKGPEMTHFQDHGFQGALEKKFTREYIKEVLERVLMSG